MRPRGVSPFRAGLIALVIVAAGTYLGFTKDIPFTRPYTLRAVFKSANSVKPGSPVRIAGVAVGKVQAVEPYAGSADAAVVVMALSDRALPIHADATAKIRPRIFLEGNFFVDLGPGTPTAPALADGDTIRITQTSTPVQLDQVLTALQDPTRTDLRTILHELGTGLQRGAPSFNRAYSDIAPAERDTAIVNQALLGTQPDRDLRRLLKGLARATEGLGRNERGLSELVSDLSTTTGAFAAEQASLRSTIRRLGPTLTVTNSALGKINAALPPTRAFARDILPGVRETPATLRAGLPWIAQTTKLLSQAELRGLAQDLSPASRDLARLVDTATRLFPQADRLARCATDTILPTGDVSIKDEFATGQPNYRELAYTLVGLAGEGENNDGNGSYVHFQPGGGPSTVQIGSAATPGGPLFANVFPGTATRPRTPGAKPPYNATVPCYRSQRPDLNGPQSAKGSFGAPAVTATPTASPAGTGPTASPTAIPTVVLLP